MNIGYWYGWGFDFIRTHYWTAWIATGALGYVVKSRLVSDLLLSIREALAGRRFVSPCIPL